MFIELIKPKVVDIERSTDRTRLRIGEQLGAGVTPAGAPGRLWLSLTYTSVAEVRALGQSIIDACEALGEKDKKQDIG